MSRETILNALAIRLNAQRAPWPKLPDGDEPYTLLADGAETVTNRDYGQEMVTMTVGIRRAVAFDGDDELRSTAANDALAALIAEVEGSDRTLGGECLDLYYVEGNTDYPSDGSALVGAIVVFSVDYMR